MIGFRINLLNYSLENSVPLSHIIVKDRVLSDFRKEIINSDEEPEAIFLRLKNHKNERLELINEEFFIESYFAIKEMIGGLGKRASKFVYAVLGKKKDFHNINVKVDLKKSLLDYTEAYKESIMAEKKKLEELQERIEGNFFFTDIKDGDVTVLREKYIVSEAVNTGPRLIFDAGLRYGQELELFNKITTSKNAPLVKFGKLYKVYADDNYKDTVKILYDQYREDFEKQIREKYVTVYLRYKHSLEPLKNNFVPLNYSIQTNSLSIDYTEALSISREELIERVEETLDLKINYYTIDRMKKEFGVTDVKLDQIVMQDIITNTDILSDFIYIDETQNISKKLLKFHVKVGERVAKINLSLPDKKNETYKVLISDVLYPISKKRNFVNVKLSDVKDDMEVVDLRKMVKYLISEYRRRYEEIADIYRLDVCPVEDNFTVYSEEPKISNYNPELWKNNAPSKLVVVPKNVVEEKKEKLENTDDMKERNDLEAWLAKTILFPAPVKGGIVSSDPRRAYRIQHYYRSETSSSVIVKLNQSDNKDLYPYIISTENSKPNFIQDDDGNITLIPKKARTSKKIGTRTGSPVELGKYSQSDDLSQKLIGEEVVRKGITSSQSSFLHCLCDIFNVKGYSDDPEGKVRRIRRILAKEWQYCMQECFDVTDARERIADPLVFFDSRLFYRLLEMKFKVNIFVITTEGNTRFEIPKYAYFHSRSFYNDCVVLNRIGSSYSIYTRKAFIDEKDDAIFPSDIIFDSFCLVARTIKYYPGEVDGVDSMGKESIEGYEMTEEELDEDWTHQEVDSFGKTNLLLGENIKLKVEPSFIRELPIVYSRKNVKIDDSRVLTIANTIRTLIDLISSFVTVSEIERLIVVKDVKYNLVTFPYFIDMIMTLDDALEYSNSCLTNFVQDGHVVVATERMKKGIIQFISKVKKDTVNLNKRYITLNDFRVNNNKEMIVYDLRKLEDYIMSGKSLNKVYSKIIDSDVPYVFTDGDRDFIMQKVSSVAKGKNLLYNWSNFKINSGDNSSDHKIDINHHLIEISGLKTVEKNMIIRLSNISYIVALYL